MRVYWIHKKTKKITLLYHNAFNLEQAMQLCQALRQCGITNIWIESAFAHRPTL